MTQKKITVIDMSVQELQEMISDAVKAEVGKIISQLPVEKPKGETLLSRKEAAQLLRISTVTLTKYVRQGSVPACRIGGKLCFKKEQVLDSLELVRSSKYRLRPGRSGP